MKKSIPLILLPLVAGCALELGTSSGKFTSCTHAKETAWHIQDESHRRELTKEEDETLEHAYNYMRRRCGGILW